MCCRLSCANVVYTTQTTFSISDRRILDIIYAVKMINNIVIRHKCELCVFVTSWWLMWEMKIFRYGRIFNFSVKTYKFFMYYWYLKRLRMNVKIIVVIFVFKCHLIVLHQYKKFMDWTKNFTLVPCIGRWTKNFYYNGQRLYFNKVKSDRGLKHPSVCIPTSEIRRNFLKFLSIVL